MIEGMFRRGPELGSRTIEIKRNPEEVFDSDPARAENESSELERLLRSIESLHRSRDGVELHIEVSAVEKGLQHCAKSIKIVWCDRFDDEGTMLQLDPIVEGRGSEGVTFGYKGRYGRGLRKEESFVFSTDSKPVSLERLFGCSGDADLRVKPTVHRWAVDKDELSISGDNAYTLYMGLGFLLSDEKWMYIGFHEVGHLPGEPDENKAWTKAKKNHAGIYKGRKSLQKDISEGRRNGLFGVLERPYYSSDLTVGRIERYGVTSHFLVGNARLPKSWRNKDYRKNVTMQDVMDDLNRRIEEAQLAYDEFFGRTR